MSAEASKKVLEDLDLSNDEVNKLKKAFDDPEFRKLFKEYAEELSDPENRKKYEEEITQMENERGMDVQFVKPNPGHVIKTNQNGSEKVFINICHNDLIGKPSVKKEVCNGQKGANWSLPHSFSQPREDLDKARKICKVYDVVYHPDTYHMAGKNVRFRQMIEDTALDGIERQFNVSLDRKNIKRPKTKFKGIPVATVIRTKRSDFEDKQSEQDSVSDPLPPFPYPYDDKKTTPAGEKDPPSNGKPESPYAEPKHSIKYSHNFDIQNFSNGPSIPESSRPSEIVVEIDLPLIRSAGCLDLDITEHRLKLIVEKPAAYLLDLKLTYPVDESKGSAKFDKAIRRLVVTLPVKKEVVQNSLTCHGDDTIIETEEDLKEHPLVEVLDSKPVDDPEIDDSKDVEEATSTELESEGNASALGVSAITYVTDVDLTTLTQQELVMKCPNVEFRQDNLHLVMLLQVKNVAAGSVKLVCNSDKPNVAAVTMTTQGEGGWPMNYALFLGCLSNLARQEEDSTKQPLLSLSIFEENTVICFKKCYPGFWSMLQYGPTMTELKEHTLPLVTSLDKIAEELSTSNRAVSSDDPERLQPHVVDLCQERIDIRFVTANSLIPNCNMLSASLNGGESSIEQSEEGSVIVIETSNSPRPAKGILKARSISTSSEETPPLGKGPLVSLNSEDFPVQDEEADLSGPEVLRKSVSFSQNHERALFTPADPVCALHQTLRNRRKKARRRGKAQRRHSGSGDDLEGSNPTLASEGEAVTPAANLRRRIHSEGDLDGLDCTEPPHPWTQVLPGRGKRTTKSPKDDNPSTPTADTPTADTPTADTPTADTPTADTPTADTPTTTETIPGDASHVNWTQLPGVQQFQNQTNNPHKTQSAVTLSDSVTFDLDDD